MRHQFGKRQISNALKILYRAAAILLLTVAAFAEKLPFKNYTTADGLGHDRVNEIVRDSRGFLWFCTGEGLSRFDGYEFKNYTQAHGLPHRSVNDLLELENGIYLVATSDGIAVFNPKGAANPQSAAPMFRPFRVPFDTTDQRPIGIAALHKSQTGEIWAGTDVGLYRVAPDGDGWRLERVEPEIAHGRILKFSPFSETVSADFGSGRERAAFKLTRRGFTLFETKEKPPYGGVTSIFAGGDTDGEIFATSSSFDLLRFDGKKFSEIQLPDVRNRSWSRNQLDLRSRVDGEWWIPSSRGLMRYAAVEKFEDLARAKPKKIYTTADGLAAGAIFNLFEDSRGDIWFSTIEGVKDRLMRWERSSEKIYLYTTDDGLPEQSAATAFAEDAQGNLWFGFYTGGVARFRGGKFQLFSARNGFPTGYVSAIYADRGGRVWIATSNSGAIRFDNPAEDEPRYTVLNVGNGLSSKLI